MNLEPKAMRDESEYREFVERYYHLVDGELKICESIQEQNNHHELALLLPKLISIVNVADYLRGQDNRFTDLRPHVSFQPELYKKEHEYENRLNVLIAFVKSTDSSKLLSDSVEEYYLRYRGLQ